MSTQQSMSLKFIVREEFADTTEQILYKASISMPKRPPLVSSQLLWIASLVMNLLSGHEVEIKSPVLPPLLGPGGQSTYDSLPVETMGWQGPPLQQPFRLFIRDNFLNDGSPRNMIPSGLTNGRAPHRWAGNLLALKQPGLGSEMWVDCNMDDVATLTRYFEWYGDKELQQQATRQGLAQLQALFPGANFLSVDLSGGN